MAPNKGNMTKLKFIPLGASTGIVIPKEMLARMKVEKGEMLCAIETAEGYLLTPFDPDIEAQFEAGRQFMNQYRDVFKALAQ